MVWYKYSTSSTISLESGLVISSSCTQHTKKSYSIQYVQQSFLCNSTALHSTAQHSTAQHSTAQHSTEHQHAEQTILHQ